MIKYCATAVILKAFSCSRLTKRLYRALGNSLGGKQRALGQMPSYYLDRVKHIIVLIQAFGSADRWLSFAGGRYRLAALGSYHSAVVLRCQRRPL